MSTANSQGISDSQVHNGTVQSKQKVRYRSIDIFRGSIIVAMILVNTIFPFENIPDWMKHIADYGMHFPDVIAPLFIFTISLTYTMSFRRYVEREGYVKTYVRFLRRYAAFLGFGFLGSVYLSSSDGFQFSWGVFQAIGMAGIFTLFFIRFSRYTRLVLGIIFLVGYQAILAISVGVGDTAILIGDINYLSRHGGFMGGLGYAIIVLIGTGIIDDFRKINKNQILYYGIGFLVAGIITHLVWLKWGIPLFGGISKMRVTPSFVSLCLGFGCIFFWVLWFIFDELRTPPKKIRILEPLGKNSFVMYILHHLLIPLILLVLTAEVHIALVILCALINVGLLWLLAIYMEKKSIFITI